MTRKPITSRAIAFAVGACVSLSGLPCRAASPEESPAAVAALARLRPGQYVRVATGDSERAQGRLVAVRDGQIILDGLAAKSPVESAQAVWVRGRQTKRGALAGGAVGALTGAAVGVFVWALTASDLPADDPVNREWPLYVGGGLAVGAAAGGLTGSLVGSALPRWERVYSTEGNGEAAGLRLSFEPAGPAAAKGDRVGSASLHLGYDKAVHSVAPSGGPSGRLSLAANFGPISPSLEVGRYEMGGRDILVAGRQRHYAESLLHVGPAFSVEVPRGVVRPYAIAGVGYYRWNVIGQATPAADDCPSCDLVGPTEFLGGSLGGGVRARATDHLSLGVEGRWHTNLTGLSELARHGDDRQRFSLASITGGATFCW